MCGKPCPLEIEVQEKRLKVLRRGYRPVRRCIGVIRRVVIIRVVVVRSGIKIIRSGIRFVRSGIRTVRQDMSEISVTILQSFAKFAATSVSKMFLLLSGDISSVRFGQGHTSR